MQAAADETVEDSPEDQDSELEQPGADLSESKQHAHETSQEAEEEQEVEEEEALPAGYISRRTTDPYMQKKLRGIQVRQSVAAPELYGSGFFEVFAKVNISVGHACSMQHSCGKDIVVSCTPTQVDFNCIMDTPESQCAELQDRNHQDLTTVRLSV